MLARYLRMKNSKIVGLFGCGPPILANPAWRFRVETIKPELIRQRKRRILNRLENSARYGLIVVIVSFILLMYCFATFHATVRPLPDIQFRPIQTPS